MALKSIEYQTILITGATNLEVADVTGQYFDQTTLATANPQAYDRRARLKLWQLSEQLTGITESIPLSTTHHATGAEHRGSES